MKGLGQLLGIVVGLGFVAGCQPAYWYREGRTFDECRADHADCHAELLRRADRNHVSDYERRFMEDCMRRRGYRLVPDSDLPLDVKRQEPDLVSAVPWNRSYGVAGTIEDADRGPGIEEAGIKKRGGHRSPPLRTIASP